MEDLEARRLLTVTINEFGGSANLVNPAGITTGPDQNLWFTEANPSSGAIGRITASGAIALYSNGLSAGATPTGIVTGSDGALWFTEAGTDMIGRIDTSGNITEFAVPTIGSFPDQITAGPDGALWFTEHDGNKIGRITTAGAITEYPIPSSNSQPVGIVTGPDGALWFAESNTDKIGRIDVQGTINEFSSGITRNSSPTGIALGPDGNLWFTELDGDQIGRITPSGVVTEFSAGISPGAGPAGIAAGSDGRLWFTEQDDGKVGAITTSGIVDEYTSPSISPTDGLAEITAGPDGNLWFTELAGNQVDRITTGGSITQFPSTTNVITPSANPVGIAAGPDDALWFTEYSADKIGRIDTSGAITEYPLGTTGATPDGITLGPVPQSGGTPELWFTEPGLDMIGEISTKGVVTQFSGLTAGSNPQGITLGPDNNLWFAEDGGDATGAIGRITPSGVVTEFTVGLSDGVFPTSIAVGPDHNLWFTADTLAGGEIGRITTQGVITEYPIAGTNSDPVGITEGLNNDLWFTDQGNVAIGRITTAGVIREFTAGLTAGNAPNQITAGPDGNYWFSDPSAATPDPVGRITPSGVITLFPTPTNAAFPLGIALGPDDNLWFAESEANQIGQIVTTQGIANPAATPASVLATVNSSFTLATFSDLSDATNAANFAATIDYGDGSTGPGTILPTATPGRYEVVGNHTYAAVGSFTARVTISTGTGNLAPLPVAITATNPQTLTGIDFDGIAGRVSNTQVASFSDLDTTAVAADFTATVTWGDGTISTANLSLLSTSGGLLRFAVYAGHTFASAGVFANSITIVDDRNGLSSTSTFSATIAAAPSTLVVIGVDVATQAGQTFTAPVAYFTDSGGPRPPGAYLLTIDWGDNTTSTGTLGTYANGDLDVIGTHTYAATGSYQIVTTVQVIGDRTNVGTSVSQATVALSTLSFVVTNTNDNGPGSLRQAILNADTDPGQTITFAIPGSGVFTIIPLSPLPQITDSTSIDGASQASFEGSAFQGPLVEVDGRSVGGTSPGLVFAGNSAGSLVQGLSIFGFAGAQVELDSTGDVVQGDDLGLRADGTIPSSSIPSPSFGTDGILILAPGAIIGGPGVGQPDVISGNAGQGIELSGAPANSASIVGNLIGLDPTGLISRGNAINGIAVDQGAGHETIGPGNVISGNKGDGIDLLGSGSDLIIGNSIGTDRGATRAIDNDNAGIVVELGSTDVTIGGTVGGSSNVISGNGSVGIVIQGASTRTSVEGNRIGSDGSGEKAVGNGIAGILISDAPGNVIGPGNVISGNGTIAQGSGIWIEGPAATGNLVFGNAIGTDQAEEASLGNSVIGVLINDASGNTIGGSFPGATNVISGNTLIGVMIAGGGASGNVVLGNRIGTNGDGSKSVSNGTHSDGSGVYIDDAPANAIVDNVISGNDYDGVQVFGPSSGGNLFQGNKIGTDIAGTHALGNGDDGLVVNGSPSTRIVSNVIDSNANDGITISGPGASGTLIQANLIGRGVDGQKLGNGSFGILIVNGAPMPAVVGNTNLNNTLGPIRDTTVAPASSKVSASKVRHPSKVYASKTTHVAVKKAKPHVKIQSKASSFRSRPMPKLQHRGKPSHKNG